jgi:ubiquinone biosynthesis monooxygenase Coq7
MTNSIRQYSTVDQLCMGLDQVLRAIAGKTPSLRPYPAKDQPESVLSNTERKHVAGLMRVNHAGEVSAQALYHGQGLVSRNPRIRAQMQQASIEEGDHLAWCSQRLIELGSHTSYLNPLWYLGSFAIGVTAGFIGDKWSLGFVAETERQVVKHLENHLSLLPSKDGKTQKILYQMQIDEAQHRDDAIRSGAKPLPSFIKTFMHFTATLMVKTAYWV